MIKKLIWGSALMGSTLSFALAKPSIPEQFALKTPFASKSILMAIFQDQSSQLSVGEHGIVINRDAGNDWSQQDVPVNITLTSITKAPNGNLFAVGHQGVILRKVVGEQWQKVFDGYELISLKQVTLEQQISDMKERIALVTDEDEMDELSFQLEDLEYAREDFSSEIESGPTTPLLDIVALTDQRILAIGAYNSLLLSEDGGLNWRSVAKRIDNPDNFHLNSVVKENNTLFLFGEAGIGYRSVDNGNSFETLYLPYEGTYFGGEINGDFVVAYGLKGNVVFSVDGGDNWQHSQIDSNATLLGSTLDAQGNAWLVGHAGNIVKLSAKDLSIISFKHESGDIFTDAVLTNDTLTLVGQNGAVQWQVKK